MKIVAKYTILFLPFHLDLSSELFLFYFDRNWVRFLFIYLAYTPCAHFLTKNLETLNSIRPRDDGKDKRTNS
jgi:hypothetical protein